MDRVVGVTVSQLLREPDMAACALLAGEKGLANVINKANIYADRDIIAWTAPHEILLMTELNLEDWPGSAFLDFLRACASRQIAALAIKFTHGTGRLTADMLEEADRLCLPLIALDKLMPIADVSSFIFRLIFAQQAETLEKHGLVHEQLLNSLLEEGKVEAVLRIIYSHISNPLGFKFADLNNPILLCDETFAFREELIAQMRDYTIPHDIGKDRPSSRVRVGDEAIERLTLPVIYKDTTFGVLFVWGINQAPDSFTYYTLETAATNIALLMLQELSLREVEVKHSSEYVAELLNPQTQRQAIEKARIYKLNPDNQFAILMLRICETGEAAEPSLFFHGRQGAPGADARTNARPPENRLKNYAILHEQREFVYDFIFRNIKWTEQILNAHQLSGLVATEKNEICVLLDTEKMHGDKQPIIALAEDLQRSYQALLPVERKLSIQAGIGKIYTGLENILYSYREAQKTIELGIHLYSKPVLHFDELGIFKIFIHVTNIGELEDFYRLTLNPLINYDHMKQTRLLSTLAAYFSNNCNVRKTSEELYTHYNTILYRLERIQQITGMDLSDSNDRLNLEMALKMRGLFPNE